MEVNKDGGIDFVHGEIEQILIDAATKHYPEQARDRYPMVRFTLSEDGLEAEVLFVSYN